MISIGKNIFIAGVLLVLPLFGFSQIDTNRIDSTLFHREHIKNQNVDEVKVSGLKLAIKDIKPLPVGVRDMSLIAANDAADVISKFSGVTVKSYGGLGGLKTVSFRSMGSGHTSIVLDGVVLNNSQTGLVNLGQIQIEELRTLSLYTGYGANLYVPVSAQVSGNVIQINSFRNYSSKKTTLLGSIKYGSFNRKEAYASVSRSIGKKWLLSAFAKYRHADGDYKYKFLNGLTEESGSRSNNDYRDLFIGTQLQYDMDNGKVYVGYKGSYIHQGLPGAVILYNETTDERLKTNDHTIYGRGTWMKKNIGFNIYGNVNQNNLNYIDPTYFNTAGEINVEYLNRVAVLGVKFQKYKYKKYEFGGGIEEIVSSLVSSDSSLSNPIRFHSKAVLAFTKKYAFGILKLLISGQYVNENTRIGSSTNELFKVNPYIEFSSKRIRKLNYQHSGTYKNSFRMPSFNELYYNSIGNSDLLPESAHQFIYSFRFEPISNWGKSLDISTNFYFNRVNNKIVAIPTKNLFVWSMQNVTNVNIFGGDIMARYDLSVGKIKYKVFANYTFQKAIDVTS
ncbi:MAG: TonB-dependent receptor, partial [Crocinitomicaceae bacterium]|nr:TonB-dependent receptor [Crocinitomicaceae bacterium]